MRTNRGRIESTDHSHKRGRGLPAYADVRDTAVLQQTSKTVGILNQHNDDDDDDDDNNNNNNNNDRFKLP